MLTDQNKTSVGHQRVVRVFVSSTFQDMHAEREELVKFTFPELRRRCRERGVEFVDVDLRWGITDEQKAEGRVLPTCLAEIERCRPYFIGLLGERYGWVPKEIDEELVKVQPWLKEHSERSVTELEILHGVLNNPKMKGQAFFYLRHPETSLKIERELSKEPGYQPEPEASRAKLRSLKEGINQSGYPVRGDFPEAKTLGQLVLKDLWDVIDKRFPKEEMPSALEQERMEHEAFAAARTKVYIGREEYFKRLDEHAKGDGLPLILLGESGSGKSALIGNWAKRYRERHPDEFMLVHFIGSTPDSTDYVRILRRIMEEIKEQSSPKPKGEIGIPSSSISPIGGAGEGDEIPTDPKKVVELFPLWLARAAARGRFILVLDALNQLEDRDNAPDLGWLPEYFPPNIRLVLSTLPGRSLNVLNRRNWPTLQIESLDIKERQQLIPEYLAQYTKELSPSRLERIATVSQTSNPLYLRALLEELRVYGDHLTLDQRIDYYLAAKTVDDLYERILERYEADYERDRPGLVQEAMSLLWAARYGLSEAELLELLGSEGESLPTAYWSPLYLAAEESLLSRSGLLNFFHDFLRKAVEDRYLPNLELKRTAHLRLADYFEGRELDDRRVDETPYQLAQAESWERLKDCLADIDMFLRLNTDKKKYELVGYWLSIGDRFDMADTYLDTVERVENTKPSQKDVADVINQIGKFLTLIARYDDAAIFFRQSIEMFEGILGQDHPDVAKILSNLGLVYYYQNKNQEAGPLLVRALEIIKKAHGVDHSDMILPLQTLTKLYLEKGFYGDTEVHLKHLLLIREKLLGPNHPDVAMSLNKLAEYFIFMGKFGLLTHKIRSVEAEPLCKRALEINKKTFGSNHPSVAITISNLAELYKNQQRYVYAEPLFKQALETQKQILGPNHPDVATILNNLAEMYAAQGKYADAEPLFKQALAIKEKAFGENHLDVVVILENLAYTYKKIGRKKEARKIRYRAFDIRLRIKKSLGQVVLPLHWEMRTSPEMQKSVSYLYRFGEKLHNSFIGKIFNYLDDKDSKLKQLTGITLSVLMAITGFTLLSGLVFKVGILFETSLNVQWAKPIFFGFGHFAYFFVFYSLFLMLPPFFREVLKLKEHISAFLGCICAFICYAVLFLWLRNHNILIPSTAGNAALVGSGIFAILWLIFIEPISRKQGNKDGLKISLGNQALIHKDRGNLDQAMSLHKEEEQICRELGNKDGLSASLGNQANIHYDRGNLDHAMELHKEKERICRELGNPSGLAYSFWSQALAWYEGRHNPKAALPLAKEALRLFKVGMKPQAQEVENLLARLSKE